MLCKCRKERVCLAQGSVTQFNNAGCQGWQKPSISEVSGCQAVLTPLEPMPDPLNHVVPLRWKMAQASIGQIPPAARYLFSLWHCRFCRWDSSWWITTTSCSGTGLVTLAICTCIVSESEGRGCPRHLGTFAISWRSLAMLLVAHRGSRSSPCASRTGLLCLSASIDIHLFSEVSWFYFIFFFRSFCVT